MKIEGLSEQGYFLWEMAESYLYVGGQVCRVDHIDGNTLFFNEVEPSLSYLYTTLKVISWASVVLPLAALAICAWYRASFDFEEVEEVMEILNRESFKQKAEEKLAAEDGRDFDYVQWAKKAKKNLIAEAEARKLLPQYLSSPKNCSANLEPLSIILFTALTKIAARNRTEEDIAFAKFVYKAVSRFCIQPSENDDVEFENNERYYKRLRFPVPESEYHATSELRAIASFLTRHLRKRIRLCNQEKIGARLDTAGLDRSAIPWLPLSWLHGTKLLAIKNACEATDCKLRPTGKLKAAPLTGEMQNGVRARGYNSSSLSGVNLLNSKTAIDYSRDYRFDLDGEKRVILSFLSLSRFMEEKGEAYQFSMNAGEMTRSLTAIRRVASYDSVWFEGKKGEILLKLDEIDQEIAKIFATQSEETRTRKILHPRYDTFYMSTFKALIDFVDTIAKILENPPAPAVLQNEDLEWAKIPVVVASSDHYGIPVDLSLGKMGSEELYPGSLSLKTDIHAVFTTNEHLETVRGYLGSQGLGHIAVEPMDLLKTVEKVDNALAPYYYDIFFKKKTA